MPRSTRAGTSCASRSSRSRSSRSAASSRGIRPLYRTLLFLAEGYGAVWLGLSPWLARKAFDPTADLSYGIYLYGWPIQQSLHALWPAATAMLLVVPALVLTIPVAAASWYGVERPALAPQGANSGAAYPRHHRAGRPMTDRTATALPPIAAIAHAARMLCDQGFHLVARNERGDSLYLQPADCAFALRVSNHARSPKQRRRRTDVLASLVVREARSAEQVEALVAGALRDFSLARRRREAQGSDATSRK